MDYSSYLRQLDGGYSSIASSIQVPVDFSSCEDIGEHYRCSYTLDFQETLNDPASWRQYSASIYYNHDVENDPNYTEHIGYSYVDSTDPNDKEGVAVTLDINGPLSGPMAYFENEVNTYVNDVNEETYSIVILADPNSGVERIDLNLNMEEVSVKDYEVVPSSVYDGGTARKFIYDWPLQNLSDGQKLITAAAFDGSGQSNPVTTLADGRQGLDKTRIYLTYDVSTERKLLEQCEQSLDAVQTLIETINEELDDKRSTIKGSLDDILEFASQQDVSFESFNTSSLELRTLEQQLENAQESLSEYSSALSCDLPLASSIYTYVEQHESFSELLRTYQQEVVSISNLILDEIEP